MWRTHVLMRNVMSTLTALHTRQRINVSVDLATKEQAAAARVRYSSLCYELKSSDNFSYSAGQLEHFRHSLNLN